MSDALGNSGLAGLTPEAKAERNKRWQSRFLQAFHSQVENWELCKQEERWAGYTPQVRGTNFSLLRTQIKSMYAKLKPEEIQELFYGIETMGQGLTSVANRMRIPVKVCKYAIEVGRKINEEKQTSSAVTSLQLAELLERRFLDEIDRRSRTERDRKCLSEEQIEKFLKAARETRMALAETTKDGSGRPLQIMTKMAI